jgi:hypothetical protein
MIDTVFLPFLHRFDAEQRQLLAAILQIGLA